MNIEASGIGLIIIVLVMALVTLVTRWGGVYIMSFVPIGCRIKQFIQAMSGSVLVAIIAPMAVTGDAGAKLALLITAFLMFILKKPLPAIAAGIVTAAVYRQL